jgi:hypothetical protein
MTIRDQYLALLDKYRGQLNTIWDLRRYDVSVRVNTWAPGTLPGGPGATKTHVDTPLVVAGGARPKVEQVSQRDVIASGGVYQDLDLRIGPITPQSAGFPAGVAPSTFDPAIAGSNVEVLFKITGPGFPAGAWFKKVGQQLAANFGFYLIVRKTGEQDG